MNRVNFLKRGEFYEWLSKSNFSFKIGASHPAELLQRAACHHYDALCLNDYDGVYGLARLYRDWRDLDRDSTYRKKLKLHYAAEIHFRSDHEAPLLFQDTLVLVVQNLSGYRNLCQIVSRMHEGQKTGSFIRWEDFVSSDLRDLVAIAPMRGLVQYKEESVWKRRCRELKELFSERFFMAMTKLHSPAEDAPLRSWMQFSQKERIHPLISQDVFFHAPERKNLHDLLQAIRLNRPVQTLGRHCFSNAERHLHGLEEIWSVYGSFDFFDQALGASRELSQSCHFSLQELRYHYPREMIPEGMTAQDYLEFLTWQKAKERFGKNLPEKIRLLLARELDLIEELEFADYFLTVWDIVRWAREQSILCQGRGSAANSAVCFVLGVTAIDPSAFDLLFERFISKERGDPPDIDIDFEHERREEVLQYVYERYGRARAAMVANVITYRGKGALRATGKALGIPEIVLSRVSDVYGSRFVQTNLPKKNKSPERDEEKQLKHQSKHQPKDQTKNQPKNEAKNEQSRSFLIIERMKKECEEDVDLGVLDRNLRAEMIAQKRGGFYWSLWAEMAEQLKGFPNHMGIHSGGFVLSDRPLNEIVAQEIATMPGRTVIQWSKEDMEALGFHKIDLLSLGMLSAVRKTFDYIDQCYGKRLKLEDIPPDDLATYSMIQRADTVGVFQIESRAQMQMLPRLRPRNFYDLVIEVAIIRPGPLQGKVVHPYLKRRHGQEAVSYAHESLKPILAKTLGVPIFQEQAMRIAMAVGDFTPGEANELRKNIGAWNMKDFSRNLKPWLLKLERGMKQKGIKRIFIDQILNEMKVFANYGFPESHAASFALIAYVSSFLKCHYPAAFICGLLNSQPMGFYRPAELVETAKRAGCLLYTSPSPRD